MDFETHDLVRLKVDLPEYDLAAGTQGMILGSPEDDEYDYAVEFYAEDSTPLDVVAVSATEIVLFQPHFAPGQRIVLLHDLPEWRLSAGDVGTLSQVEPAGTEVEFATLNGRRYALVRLEYGWFRRAGSNEIATTRPLQVN